MSDFQALRSIPQRRKVFLEIIHRRVHPGTGSSLKFLETRMAERLWPDLSLLLEGIDWCVVGGVATRAYMPERATQDLDILVHLNALELAQERIRQAGYEFAQDLWIAGSSWRSPDGMMIELIASSAPWLADAFQSLQSDPQGLPVISFPYLVLMKFQAGRTQDLADVSRMLGLASAELRDLTRAIFIKWEAGGLPDLESLITLGELELGMADKP